jgi:hypothetical protein
MFYNLQVVGLVPGNTIIPYLHMGVQHGILYETTW